jgi:hypothetical protein
VAEPSHAALHHRNWLDWMTTPKHSQSLINIRIFILPLTSSASLPPDVQDQASVQTHKTCSQPWRSDCVTSFATGPCASQNKVAGGSGLSQGTTVKSKQDMLIPGTWIIPILGRLILPMLSRLIDTTCGTPQNEEATTHSATR